MTVELLLLRRCFQLRDNLSGQPAMTSAAAAAGKPAAEKLCKRVDLNSCHGNERSAFEEGHAAAREGGEPMGASLRKPCCSKSYTISARARALLCSTCIDPWATLILRMGFQEPLCMRAAAAFFALVGHHRDVYSVFSVWSCKILNLTLFLARSTHRIRSAPSQRMSREILECPAQESPQSAPL